jgi:hypothetical protein
MDAVLSASLIPKGATSIPSGAQEARTSDGIDAIAISAKVNRILDKTGRLELQPADNTALPP